MANNISVKDSAGTDTVVKTTDNAGVHTPHHNVDTLTTITNVVHVDDNGATLSMDDGGGSITIDDGGGAVTVDGTVDLGAATLAALETITIASLTAALPAGNNNIGDVDIASIAAGNNNIGDVDVASMPTGANAAQVQGTVAHDVAAANNPVLVAARANTNEPTAVSNDGDATHLWADLFGRLVVLAGHPNPEAPVSLNATASGNTTVIAAPGASVSIYVCKGSIHNRGAANIVARLEDGAGGTVRWRAELAAEGGGSLFDFGSRGWKLSGNTLLNVNLSAAGDVDVNITEYYLAP